MPRTNTIISNNSRGTSSISSLYHQMFSTRLFKFRSTSTGTSTTTGSHNNTNFTGNLTIKNRRIVSVTILGMLLGIQFINVFNYSCSFYNNYNNTITTPTGDILFKQYLLQHELPVDKDEEEEQVDEVPITTELKNIPSKFIIQDHVFCGGCFFSKINSYEKPTKSIGIRSDDTTSSATTTISNDITEQPTTTPPKTCGEQIRRFMYEYLQIDENNSGLLTEIIHTLYTTNHTVYYTLMEQASYSTYQQYPVSCIRCNPQACRRSRSSGTGAGAGAGAGGASDGDGDGAFVSDESNETSLFHRYDTVAPKIYKAWTHYLPSIPHDYRFPISGMDNLVDYFANHDDKQRDYFFEYNPSIVLLPNREVQYISHPTTGALTKAVYLASYRVSNLWWCFSMDYIGQLNRTNGYLEYTGLALLDEDLTILQDGIFENNGAEDPRLFVLRDENNQLQIYFTINNYYRALWIKERPPENSIHQVEVMHSIFGTTTSTTNPDTNSTSSLLSTIYVGPKGCLTIGGGVFGGKNFIYFDDPTITPEMVPYLTMKGTNYTTTITGPVAAVENWPPQEYDGLHRTSLVQVSNPQWCYPNMFNYNADDGEFRSSVTSPSRELVDTRSKRQSDTSITSTTTTQKQQKPVYEPIQPSFYTLEEVWFGRNLLVDVPPWHSERGSACCIEMIDPRSNSTVLVGISHANIRAESWAPGLPDRYYDTYFRPGHNSYLSRFYAFQPTIPYKTVALSGHFCWPMSNPSDFGNNPYHGRGDKMHYLEATNVTDTGYCAKIHFVMSLTFKANTNKESILVTYGVDDCVPRIIEIKSNEVMELLFYGFSRQKQHSRI